MYRKRFCHFYYYYLNETVLMWTNWLYFVDKLFSRKVWRLELQNVSRLPSLLSIWWEMCTSSLQSISYLVHLVRKHASLRYNHFHKVPALIVFVTWSTKRKAAGSVHCALVAMILIFYSSTYIKVAICKSLNFFFAIKLLIILHCPLK